MRRRLLCVWLLLSVLLGMAGIGQAKQVPIEAWIMDYNDRTQKWLDEEFVPAFHAAHPDIRVTLIYQKYDWAKFVAALAAGVAPEIYQGGSTFRGHAGGAGFGMNIDRYTKNWPDKKDFFPAAWEAVVWDGSDYGIPSLSAPRSIVYRADLMAESGFNPDVNPTEWDEVQKVALKLSKVDATGRALRWGFYVPKANADLWFALLAQNETQFSSPDGSQPLFNTPLGVEATQWYYDFWKAQSSFGGAAPSGNLSSGAWVMHYSNANLAINQAAANPALKDDIRVGYPMKRRIPAAPTYTDSLFMTAQAKNPDEAWEFLKFFARPDNLAGYNTTLQYLPPRKASLTPAYLAQNVYVKQMYEKAMPHATGRPVASTWTGVLSALADIFNDKATPQAALEHAAAIWQPFTKQ